MFPLPQYWFGGDIPFSTTVAFPILSCCPIHFTVPDSLISPSHLIQPPLLPHYPIITISLASSSPVIFPHRCPQLKRRVGTHQELLPGPVRPTAGIGTTPISPSASFHLSHAVTSASNRLSRKGHIFSQALVFK